jgi:hypothetical protein
MRWNYHLQSSDEGRPSLGFAQIFQLLAEVRAFVFAVREITAAYRQTPICICPPPPRFGTLALVQTTCREDART